MRKTPARIPDLRLRTSNTAADEKEPGAKRAAIRASILRERLRSASRRLSTALVFLSTVVVITASAADLPDRYRRWLDEDVHYIITKADREIFMGLQTDHERDVFIENFWKKLDPVPITPQNEFREEHYQRLAHARDHYGLHTDQGRIWILLGKPDKITARPVDNNFYAMEYWDYTRLRVPGLPPDLRLLFYKKWGVGSYVLYSPLFDGVRALLVKRTLDPDKREVQKWLTATMDIDFRLATRSVSTGLSEFQSQDVIAKLSWNYGELLDRFRKHTVQAKIVYEGEQTLTPALELYYFPGEHEDYRLELGLELPPEGLTFEQVGEKLVSRTDMYAQLLDSENRPVDEVRDNLTMELDKQQLEASKSYPLLYTAGFPVVPGTYSVEVLVRDFSSGRIGKVRQSIRVEPPTTGKLFSTPVVLAYKLERALPSNERLPFRHGGFRLYPRVTGTFAAKGNVYFYLDLSAPTTAAAAGPIPLRYDVLQDAKPVLSFDGKAELKRGPVSIAQGFSNEGLQQGEYIFRVVAPDPQGDVKLAERPFTIKQDAGTNARFIFEQAAADPAGDHFALGLERLYRGEAEQAAVEFGIARDFAPWMAQAAINLARTRILLGQHSEALGVLDTLLKDDPVNVDALMVRAQALINLNRMTDVDRVLARLIELAPTNTTVLNYCAETYLRRGDRKRGIELFNRSIELNPEQPEVTAVLKGQE